MLRSPLRFRIALQIELRSAHRNIVGTVSSQLGSFFFIDARSSQLLVIFLQNIYDIYDIYNISTPLQSTQSLQVQCGTVPSALPTLGSPVLANDGMAARASRRIRR